MSPRRNRPRGARPPEPPERPRLAPEVVPAPEGWQVRAIQPASADKEYVCPGCNQQIRRGWGHVVAWRHGAEDERRHWHTPCWRREHGRAR